MKDTGCQTNDYAAHWNFFKQTKTIKNKNELKKFMMGVDVPDLENRNYTITRKRSFPLTQNVHVEQKQKKIEKRRKGPPTKQSENGLDILESD